MDMYEVKFSQDYGGSRVVGLFSSKQLADSVKKVLNNLRKGWQTYGDYEVYRRTLISSVEEAKKAVKYEIDNFYEESLPPGILDTIGGKGQPVQASVPEYLDILANDLESKGLLAEAEQLDIIANTIDAAVEDFTLKASDPRRNRINRILSEVSKEYTQSIPLDKIFKALEDNGLVAIDEDGTEWEGLLTGREGRATIDVAFLGEVPKDRMRTPIKNAKLVVSWYKMPSGKYETTTYLG